MNLSPRIHGTRYFPFSADGRENGATETGPRWLWWKLLIGSGRVVGHSESAHPGPKSPRSEFRAGALPVRPPFFRTPESARAVLWSPGSVPKRPARFS